MSAMQIQRVTVDNFATMKTGLAIILEQCVQSGASIGFLQPFDLDKARDYWECKVFPGLALGSIYLWGAYLDNILVGTVQLNLAMPENQQHRADVAKLLVHPEYQRLGIARALMLVLEQSAISKQIKLLVLDTETGSNAESLYLSLGYDIVGNIDDFAREVNRLEYASTTIMCKHLKE
ncbi:MAG: GNAT family N-acetyltransferase [Oceanospirillaceae bacterium]|nr:GNAT family N-acetyltransferase [Oceanospirillaceae bacterium]